MKKAVCLKIIQKIYILFDELVKYIIICLKQSNIRNILDIITQSLTKYQKISKYEFRKLEHLCTCNTLFLCSDATFTFKSKLSSPVESHFQTSDGTKPNS